MSKILELFGLSTERSSLDWGEIVQEQNCPFLRKRCYKVRKSDPEISIGTCSVVYGKEEDPVIICPTRLIENGQIFTDCLHLLTTHEPGNELHLVPEVTVPGGSVDFFLVSLQRGKVKDFVGIELQTLDTTGTVWPERQRCIKELGLDRLDDAEQSRKTYGMNWKMTAKTILVQMHHKIQTFEHVNKKLVLVVQDRLLDYMRGEFKFDHLESSALVGDSMHFHAYRMSQKDGNFYGISLSTRLSTDAEGMRKCLGLQAEARIELAQIIETLEARISPATLFSPVSV